ncbi:glucose-1-phosphate adenylyltransferase [bacterium]|nr:glucose-1-phosphate adenylyltransferase [bacterium]MBU1064507.1 glucose-1-phosphate adenylyltransferase [bacterium]MBU1874617.1 glucose-1-phosphate adenylyltransferase [bacterium]
MRKSDVLAVVLGGGKGTRLYPLTKYRAKPAVPFGGKFRIIDVPISNCLNSNIDQIYILTQFNTESLHRHIYSTYRLGRFTEGFVDILAAQQTTENMDWYQGTADAVRQNLEYIKEVNASYTIILSGDHLYRMDYNEFLKTHVEKKADITISVKPVSRNEASGFGILKTDQESRIHQFVEKPESNQLDAARSPGLTEETPFLASMGIYIFTTKVLIDILNQSSSDDFGRHIIPSSIGSYRVFAHSFSGYWRDIGTMESFFNANLELTSLKPPFTFYDENFPIYTRARSLPGSRVDNCSFEHTLLADGCFIEKSKIRKSVVGIRTIISRNSELENCVLMGNDFYESNNINYTVPIGIGENCIIKNAIIDKNARIGNNVRIINRDNAKTADRQNYYIREGIVVIPKNTTIPDNQII